MNPEIVTSLPETLQGVGIILVAILIGLQIYTSNKKGEAPPVTTTELQAMEQRIIDARRQDTEMQVSALNGVQQALKELKDFMADWRLTMAEK